MGVETILVHCFMSPLQWCHNEHDGISNHQPHDCLRNHLFRHRWKKTSKLRVTGLCEGNSPGTGEFPAQRASNAENVSIWWRYHAVAKPSSTSWAHQSPLYVSRLSSGKYCWNIIVHLANPTAAIIRHQSIKRLLRFKELSRWTKYIVLPYPMGLTFFICEICKCEKLGKISTVQPTNYLNFKDISDVYRSFICNKTTLIY